MDAVFLAFASALKDSSRTMYVTFTQSANQCVILIISVDLSHYFFIGTEIHVG